MTPEQRRLRAKIAANARWSHQAARTDQAEAARSAIFARLERQIDPDGTLPPDQRAVLVRCAARRLSAQLNAAKARKNRTAMTLSRCAAGPENRVDGTDAAPDHRHCSEPHTDTACAYHGNHGARCRKASRPVEFRITRSAF